MSCLYEISEHPEAGVGDWINVFLFFFFVVPLGRGFLSLLGINNLAIRVFRVFVWQL